MSVKAGEITGKKHKSINTSNNNTSEDKLKQLNIIRSLLLFLGVNKQQKCKKKIRDNDNSSSNKTEQFKTVSSSYLKHY